MPCRHPLLAFAAALILPGCHRQEPTALERFEHDVLVFRYEAEGQQANFKADGAALLKAWRERVGKMKAIDTTGLPSDLQEAWRAVIGDFDAITVIVADLSAVAADPALLAKVQATQKRANEYAPKIAGHAKALAGAAQMHGLIGFETLFQ